MHHSFLRRREKFNTNRCCFLPKFLLIKLPSQQLLEWVLEELDDLDQLESIFDDLIQLDTVALLSRQALNHPLEVFPEIL